MHTLERVGAAALGIGWLSLLFIQGSGYSPEQVLQALQENDQIFWQNYSLTLSVESPDLWQQTVSYRLRATSNQRATVVIRDQVYYHGNPTYSTLVEWGKQFSRPNPFDTLLGEPYIRWTQTWYLQEGKLYAEAERPETVFISPENTVKSVSPWPYLSLFIRRSSNCPSYNWLKYGENALGRGFSPYLGSALSVRELPDGRLEFWATDKTVAGNRWRLIIDPSLRFLVVQAELLKSDGTIRERWQSEGVVEATIPIARRGTMYWYNNNTPPEISRFECVSYEPCFRADWYEEVRQLIRRPPAGTEVIDYRVEPFTTFTIK